MNESTLDLVEYLYRKLNTLEEQINMAEEKLAHTEKERDHYFNLCQSYEMWMNRSIARIKEMQVT